MNKVRGHKNRRLCIVNGRIGVFLALALATQIQADGFHIAAQSPEALGKGNAFVATADTASAVYYNAAGLTQLSKTELQVGAYAVLFDSDANVTGGRAELDSKFEFVPQVYMAKPINEKLVLGFGLNSPFGLSSDWGSNNPFRTLAIDTELIYATFSAVAGYQLTEKVAIGGGITVSRADVDFGRGIGLLPDDQFRFNGDDIGTAITLSARYTPSEKHAFGVVYRGKTEFDLQGESEAIPFTPAQPASLDFVTPSSFAIGYSYQIKDQWNAEINIEQINWDELNTLTLNQPGASLSLPFEWQDSRILSLGVEKRLNEYFTVRTGYNFIENSQPDLHFNPGVPDQDRHWFNLGLGGKYDNWYFNTALQYSISSGRTVGADADSLAQGDYDSRLITASASFGFYF